jgi:bifunctional non-homologous end joining protein LigD
MPKKPLPQFIPAMQASSVKEPFDSPDWIFETKLDGYRAIVVIGATGKARIWSRNQLRWNRSSRQFETRLTN